MVRSGPSGGTILLERALQHIRNFCGSTNHAAKVSDNHNAARANADERHYQWPIRIGHAVIFTSVRHPRARQLVCNAGIFGKDLCRRVVSSTSPALPATEPLPDSGLTPTFSTMQPDPNQITIASKDPESLQARACLAAYFAVLSDRIDGISASHVPDPDPEANAFRPPTGTFLLATLGEDTVACVCLKQVGPATGEVKRLWVAPAARGRGLARRMMLAVEGAARGLGMTSLRLDTNAGLPEAIALYRVTGWTDTAPFSGFPATHWFAKTI
jgi:GNAT superfamily N-acetyltransferase